MDKPDLKMVTLENKLLCKANIWVDDISHFHNA